MVYARKTIKWGDEVERDWGWVGWRKEAWGSWKWLQEVIAELKAEWCFGSEPWDDLEAEYLRPQGGNLYFSHTKKNVFKKNIAGILFSNWHRSKENSLFPRKEPQGAHCLAPCSHIRTSGSRPGDSLFPRFFSLCSTSVRQTTTLNVSKL